MKNQKKRVCGHFFLLCAIVTIFGCGAESASPSTEPLRGILGDGSDTDQGEAQEYTDDGVPIITTDQEEERQRDQASHTANGELTCTGIFNCFNSCADEDQACVQSCANQGSEQARMQVDAIAICMENNQCADNACVETQCAPELAACGFGQDGHSNDDHSGNTGNTGDSSLSNSAGTNQLDCNGIYECFGECPEGDRDCLDDCFGQGSSDAQSQVNAIGQCAQDNQCQDGACVESNCPSQVAACNGDEPTGGNSGGVAATGTLSCAEIFECYGQCARGDQGCLDRCERAGTSSAQSQVNAIGSCIERNQCEDSGCVDRMCANEVANCGDESSPGGSAGTQEPNLGGSGSGSGSGSAQGTQSCLDVFECFETCTESDRGCLDNCYEQGSALAQLAVSNVGSCVQANQCQDDDCVSRMCPQEVAACEGQSGGNSGGATQPPAQDSNLACTDIYECFRECTAQDQACRQACFDRGSITSQGQVNAIGSCVQANQCEDDECVETHCYEELSQCGFDIELPEEDTTYIDPLNPPQDGDDSPDSGGINTMPPGQVNGMCGGAYPLTWGTQTGTTTGSASEHRGTCSGNGSEAVFEFTLDEDTMICLDTFDSSFDTAIYVRADECGSQGTEVACNDDTYGIQSQVHFSAQAGVTYYVFVDSYDLSGNFNLTATRGDCRDRFGF